MIPFMPDTSIIIPSWIVEYPAVLCPVHKEKVQKWLISLKPRFGWNILTASPNAYFDPWIHPCKVHGIYNITSTAAVDNEIWISVERWITFCTRFVIRDAIELRDNASSGGTNGNTNDRIRERFILIFCAP
jgi:hypothetical protein